MITLNTKQDYISFLQINPEEAKKRLQELLNNRFAWFDVAVIDEDIETDDTHRIVGDDEKIYQEYRENPNAYLFLLGFTVTEIEDLINEN